MSDNVSGRKKIDVGNRQRSTRKIASSSSDLSVYKSSDEGSVRYKGSKESSVYKSSDEFFEYSCDPCSSAGDHLEAEGFCTNCGEYLCGTCFRSHSRGKATKHHTLLNKDNMPRKQVQTCDPCKTAGEEIEATGYCENCREYLCSSCFRSHSRSKATKQHTLMDKDNMPEESNSAIASSIAKIDIHKEGARYQRSKDEYSYVRDINVKAAGDARDCHITAMTLMSNTELILADIYNKSLKLVDVARNVMKAILNLESEPYGLTTVSKDEILQLSGAVDKTIKPDAEVLKHCTFPDYIAVSPDESVIYVSDWKTNKVMCINMDGNMISMYQNELAMPRDIVISSLGSVYLCNRDQHVIFKMTPDLSGATVLLGPGDGLFAPQSMCCNTAKQHFYISSGSNTAEKCNQIKVFKWHKPDTDANM